MIENGSKCSRHGNAQARFVCDSCGESFCSHCRCELLGGSVCCTECAVERAGESGGVIQHPHGSGLNGVDPRGKAFRFGRLLTVVLLVCLPLLVLEGLFLLRSRADHAGSELEAQRVMSDTLVLITVLNGYRENTGAYPVRLPDLVPTHWKPGDMAELDGYEYRRIGMERFVLLPQLTGDENEMAGIARARSLIPRSLGRDSDLDVFLRSVAASAAPHSAGGAP
jgi:hypothetical protein